MIYLQKADDFIGKFGWTYRVKKPLLGKGRKDFSLDECLAANPKAALIRFPKELSDNDDKHSKGECSKMVNMTLIALYQLCKTNAVIGTKNLEYDTVFATTCLDTDPDLKRILPYVVKEMSVDDATQSWDDAIEKDLLPVEKLAAISRLWAFHHAEREIHAILKEIAYNMDAAKRIKTQKAIPPHLPLEYESIQLDNICSLFWGVEDAIFQAETVLDPFSDHADSILESVYKDCPIEDEIAIEIANLGRQWSAAIASNPESITGLQGCVDANDLAIRLLGDITSAKIAVASGVPLEDVIA